jgi:uncharacterized protein HemY
MENLGKILMLFGLVFVFFGLLFLFLGRLPYLGKLPGDIFIKKENFTFYFPLATCLLISLFFSVVFYFISKFLK